MALTNFKFDGEFSQCQTLKHCQDENLRSQGKKFVISSKTHRPSRPRRHASERKWESFFEGRQRVRSWLWNCALYYHEPSWSRPSVARAVYHWRRPKKRARQMCRHRGATGHRIHSAHLTCSRKSSMMLLWSTLCAPIERQQCTSSLLCKSWQPTPLWFDWSQQYQKKTWYQNAMSTYDHFSTFTPKKSNTAQEVESSSEDEVYHI